MLNFEMIKHARTLQETLLPDYRDPQDELDAILDRGFEGLSQKDHWDSNGVLHHLMDWSERQHDRLLWIGGISGATRDSWVTEMSADLVRALQPRDTVVPLFVFCDAPGAEPLTPVDLVKRLLVQLLERHPQLAYRHPELCNTWKFARSLTFRQVWRLFEQLATKTAGLIIVVDKIEDCLVDDRADLVNDLLPALIEIGEGAGDVSVIVTSTCDPPPEADEYPLYSAFIDTAARSKHVLGTQ
jgi:hypothetical protein